jgi:hypothetical protein
VARRQRQGIRNPSSRAAYAGDVLSVYDYDDWRALSRRLSLKLPNIPIPALRFSRPLLAACALLLIVAGVLIWLDYWR